MWQHNLAVVSLFLVGSSAVSISPASAEVAQSPSYSTNATDIGTLIDNPATKAVLDKDLPGFSGNPQIEMARSMTLKQIQGFSDDAITDAVLAKIDEDLAKISKPK